MSFASAWRTACHDLLGHAELDVAGRHDPQTRAAFAAAYDQLTGLARPERRRILRRVGRGLAGAALLLALGRVPSALANTIIVNGNGTGGTCDLNGAIRAANADAAWNNCPAGSGADTISLQVDVGLTASPTAVTSDITLEGNGHTISRTSGSVRLLKMTSGNVTVRNATLSGGSMFNNNGSAIYNQATLTVINCTLTGNTSITGGAIYNLGSLLLQNSTLSGNTADWAGALYNVANAVIENSTISGNSAGNVGGIANQGTIVIRNSTITANSAGALAGGIHNSGGSFSLQNSIVALQTAGADCSPASPGAFTSLGYNIEGGTSCGFAETGDQQTVSSGALKLGSLADNGGPTQTHALGAGSVAIDVVPTGTAGLTDQRGVQRDHGAGNKSDVGAYEVGQVITQGDCGGADLSGEQTFAFTSGTVTIYVNTANGLKCISVEEAGADYPAATANMQTGNWWHITGNISSGFNVDLDVPINFTPGANARLCRYSKTGPYGWACLPATANAGTLHVSGITAFSDWTAGNEVGPNSVQVRELRGAGQAWWQRLAEWLGIR